MVVHMVPRAHHPAAKETAGSTWAIHSESTHHSRGDLFVSPSLCLPDWIRNVGGLVNPRLEEMTWCIIEAQHCCTPKLCSDVFALIVHDSDIYCKAPAFRLFLTEPPWIFLHLFVPPIYHIFLLFPSPPSSCPQIFLIISCLYTCPSSPNHPHGIIYTQLLFGRLSDVLCLMFMFIL